MNALNGGSTNRRTSTCSTENDSSTSASNASRRTQRRTGPRFRFTDVAIQFLRATSVQWYLPDPWMTPPGTPTA